MFHHVFLFAIILSSIIDVLIIHITVWFVLLQIMNLFFNFMHTYANITFWALSLDNQHHVFFFL